MFDVLVYDKDFPDREDPEIFPVRTCKDCQHFRYRSDWEGFCTLTAEFTPELTHASRSTIAIACDDVMPIGYELDF